MTPCSPAYERLTGGLIQMKIHSKVRSGALTVNHNKKLVTR
jgi:hypothetical protein